jgi:hypothetical protein
MDNKWLIDIDEYEDKCICMRSKTAYVYLYPFVPEAYQVGMKVMTRDGRLVKKVRVGGEGPKAIVVGILDGEELRWDAAGRFEGPYKNSPNDLFIQERYLQKDWRLHMSMSNAEWAIRFGIPHPTVKIPK